MQFWPASLHSTLDDSLDTSKVDDMSDDIYIDKETIAADLMELCTEHESRKQLAEEQGLAFTEDLSLKLGDYVEALPLHEQEFARSLEGQHDVSQSSTR